MTLNFDNFPLPVRGENLVMGKHLSLLMKLLNQLMDRSIDRGVFALGGAGVNELIFAGQPSIGDWFEVAGLRGDRKYGFGAGTFHVDLTIEASLSDTLDAAVLVINADSTVSQAQGSLTAIAFNDGVDTILEGDTFVLSDGVFTLTFEFDGDGSYTPGNIPVVLAGVGPHTATVVGVAIQKAILESSVNVIAGGFSPNITLTGQNLISANVAITETLAQSGTGATLTPVGMVGGDSGGEIYALKNDSSDGLLLISREVGLDKDFAVDKLGVNLSWLDANFRGNQDQKPKEVITVPHEITADDVTQLATGAQIPILSWVAETAPTVGAGQCLSGGTTFKELTNVISVNTYEPVTGNWMVCLKDSGALLASGDLLMIEMWV